MRSLTQQYCNYLIRVSLAMGGRGQIQTISDAIAADTKAAAEAYLRVLKNTTAMKSEFAVFEQLYSPNPQLKPRYHAIHKVIVNVISVFFQEFQEKSIEIEMDKSIARLIIDYESFSVAFYHLIQNAAKYCRSNTKIEIHFGVFDNEFKIRLVMESLKILNSEVEKIFEEGVSGDQAKRLEKAGEGIGMGLARRLIELNGGRLVVIPGQDTRSMISNLTYAMNTFEMIFPKKNYRDGNA